MSHAKVQEFSARTNPARERYVGRLSARTKSLMGHPGIDVQAELALKGSPHLRPVQRPSMASQASPMQKAMLNRQQQVRQRPIAAPPLQTGNPSSRGGQGNFAGSPTGQPTPPSQHSSPSTGRSPGFALQGGMTSPASDLQAQNHQQRPMAPSQRPSFPPQHRAHSRNLSSPATSRPLPSAQHPTSAAHQSAYYPSSFQKHYDQLGKLSPFLFPSPVCGALFVLG